MAISLVKIAKKVYDRINSETFVEGAKMRTEDFTRNRKMNFKDYILFILSGTKKSLQAALYTFFKEMNRNNVMYSKQAFSNGRKRIKPEAILELFNLVTESFYEEAKLETYREYRVTAIDGTKYNLPYSEELLEEYGMQESTGIIQALGSCLYDVLNGMMIDVCMDRFNGNERLLAEKHINRLNEIKTEKELILMDRGYPSSKLFKTIDDKGFKYLSRCEPNFIKRMKIKSDDEILTYTFVSTGITLKLRVVKIMLDNGNIETLVTNILDESFTKEDFKKLYHLRWGIEENYKNLKSKLEIENFSGCTKLAVLQDFYAVMFLNNLAGIAVYENKSKIYAKNKESDLKYDYQTNISMTISLLKLNVLEMLYTTSDIKRRHLCSQIRKKLQKCVVPIRPNRSYTRSVKHPALKFPNNTNSL